MIQIIIIMMVMMMMMMMIRTQRSKSQGCEALKQKLCLLVIEALGRDKRAWDNMLKNFVKKIPGNINIEDLQKISLLGTAQISRKLLSTTNLIMTPPSSRYQGNWQLVGLVPIRAAKQEKHNNNNNNKSLEQTPQASKN